MHCSLLCLYSHTALSSVHHGQLLHLLLKGKACCSLYFPRTWSLWQIVCTDDFNNCSHPCVYAPLQCDSAASSMVESISLPLECGLDCDLLWPLECSSLVLKKCCSFSFHLLRICQATHERAWASCWSMQDRPHGVDKCHCNWGSSDWLPPALRVRHMNKAILDLLVPLEPLEDCSHTNDPDETSRRISQLSTAQIANSKNYEQIKLSLS